MTSPSLLPSLRVGGYRSSFKTTEATEYVVATVEVRIALDPSREAHPGNRAEGVEVMAHRAVHAAADAYGWYSAKIDSVSLVSVSPESVDV